jgi:hypothetical protein
MIRWTVVLAALLGVGLYVLPAMQPQGRFQGPVTSPASSGRSTTLHPASTGHSGHKHQRSREVTREFQREHPCPSTGKQTGACPGYVKDHVVALCAGGPDVVSNLQWQTTAEGKAKDQWECKGAR